MIEVKLAFTSYEDALEALSKLAGKAVIQEFETTHEHVEQPKPKKEKPAPVAPKVEPTPEPVAEEKPATPEMPAPPTFDNPVPELSSNVDTAPFTDNKGMIAYVMGAYKELGAQKGAGIQQVLTALGYSNINDVSPDKYAALYQGIENLKG